jgi:hypothetical protein
MALFDQFKKRFANLNEQPSSSSVFDEVVLASIEELKARNEQIWEFKINTYKTYKSGVARWSDAQRIQFVHYLVKEIADFKEHKDDVKSKELRFQEAFLKQLMRTKLLMNEQEVQGLIQLFLEHNRYGYSNAMNWPIAQLLNQVHNQYKGQTFEADLKDTFQSLKTHLEGLNNYTYEQERLKLISKVEDLLLSGAESLPSIKPVRFLGSDEFAKYANDKIEGLDLQHREYWYPLIAHAQKASGGKPTQKYLATVKPLIEALGFPAFKNMLNDWFLFLVNLKERKEEHVNNYITHTYTYTTYHFLDSVTIDEIKGFIWMASHLEDKNTLHLLSRLAERSYRKIPGQGPAAAAVGNACLYTLYKSAGLYGVGQLSGLKFRIKREFGDKIIDCK